MDFQRKTYCQVLAKTKSRLPGLKPTLDSQSYQRFRLAKTKSRLPGLKPIECIALLTACLLAKTKSRLPGLKHTIQKVLPLSIRLAKTKSRLPGLKLCHWQHTAVVHYARENQILTIGTETQLR